MSSNELIQGNSIYKEILRHMKKYVNISFVNFLKY